MEEVGALGGGQRDDFILFLNGLFWIHTDLWNRGQSKKIYKDKRETL